MNEAGIAFERLLGIMNDLREKCPWDRKQTLESLRILTIEETYELADAIDLKDMKLLKEEIGDLMLHMIFYAKITSEQKQFDITETINDLCEKLIRRHPHIYGNVIAENEEAVKRNWEQIKMPDPAVFAIDKPLSPYSTMHPFPARSFHEVNAVVVVPSPPSSKTG